MSNVPSAGGPAGPIQPYVPASTTLPELTIGVIVLGSVLAIVLGAANAYLGLFAGLTVSASIPAAVVSMALMRLVGGNILQNNGVQTAAASGEGLAAGAAFTLPAMIILGKWSSFSYLETTLIAGFGGVLGVLFTIPLRRALIIDQPLQFPEGVATAEVLKVGAGGQKGGVAAMLLGSAIGLLFKLGAGGLKLWAEAPAYATRFGQSAWYVGANVSPALVAVGYIVGLNVALVIFAGGALNRWIAIPIWTALNDYPATMSPAEVVGEAHKVMRFIGVGGMLVGGLWALIKLRSSLLRGVVAGLEAYKRARAGGGSDVPRTERDIPMNWVMIAIGVSVVPLFFIFLRVVDSAWIAAVMAVLMIIAGFLFSAVASYMAGLVGSSNNPVSGITVATVLTTALILLGLGADNAVGPTAAVLIGGVVCCAAAIGGDNLQDLKCGQLVGSTPWRQQIMQIVGVIAAALVLAPILDILNTGYGFVASEAHPRPLGAPQANLMANVAHGVFKGGLPWEIVGIGAGLAVLIILLDIVLEKRGASFRVPVLAFSVGVYLPFDLSPPILFGGVLAWLAQRALARRKASADERQRAESSGLLFAAGLITGEALMGIGIALPVVIAADQNVMTLFKHYDETGALLGGRYEGVVWPGLALLMVVMYLTYRYATRTRA